MTTSILMGLNTILMTNQSTWTQTYTTTSIDSITAPKSTPTQTLTKMGIILLRNITNLNTNLKMIYLPSTQKTILFLSSLEKLSQHKVTFNRNSKLKYVETGRCQNALLVLNVHLHMENTNY